MALTATIFRFELNLSDVDRGVYEALELRVARHPSETDEYMVTRVLAMALEHREGRSFGRGISTPEDPPLSAPGEHGTIALWVEIGHPAPERLHKITKQAADVAVYTHKDPAGLLADLGSGKVHRGDEVRVVAFAPAFVAKLVEMLDRKNPWEVLRNEGNLYVTVGETVIETMPSLLGA